MGDEMSECEQWVFNWLLMQHEASSVSQEFHEQFHAAFPQYRVKTTNWGAQPVSKAMKTLKQMYDRGIISRCRIGLGLNWQPGFPRSALSYHLSNEQRLTKPEARDE